MPVETEASLSNALRKLLLSLGIKNVNMSALLNAVTNNDVETIARLLGITGAAFSDTLQRITNIYVQSGQTLLGSAPASLVGEVSFGLASPKALSYVSQKSSTLVKGISDEQRSVIRKVLNDAYLKGSGPKSAVKVLAGTKGSAGTRGGSIIGLSENQAEWVLNAREDLSRIHESQEALDRYLSRKRRDKRFDAAIKKAFAQGTPLKRDAIDKIAGRYTDRLLAYRAEVIARTEFKEATNKARIDAALDLVEAGKVSEDQVMKEWDSTGDRKVRSSHVAMDGQRVPLNEAFTTPDGYKLKHPGDTSLGAPASETIQCRCVMKIKINFYKGLR